MAAVQAPLDLEARNLQNGEYVAVRRFTRILEGGVDAKAEVDQVGWAPAWRAGGGDCQCSLCGLEVWRSGAALPAGWQGAGRERSWVAWLWGRLRRPGW